jgi:hypothetical protein
MSNEEEPNNVYDMKKRRKVSPDMVKTPAEGPSDNPDDYYSFHIGAGLQEDEGQISTFVMIGDQAGNQVIFPREVVLTLVTGLLEAYQLSRDDIATYAAQQSEGTPPEGTPPHAS